MLPMIMLNISFLVGKYFSFSKTVGWICASGVVAHIVVCAGASSLPSSLFSPAQEKSGVPATRGSTFYWCR